MYIFYEDFPRCQMSAHIYIYIYIHMHIICIYIYCIYSKQMKQHRLVTECFAYPAYHQDHDLYVLVSAQNLWSIAKLIG